MPDQLSPFGCSITKGMVERYGTQPVRRFGIRLQTKDPFSAYFYGRAFLNVTMMLEVREQSPFGSREALLEQFLGQGPSSGPPLEGIDLNKGGQRPLLSRLFRYAIVLPRMLWHTGRMPGEIRRARRITRELARRMEARGLLDDLWDFYYLTWDEAKSLLRGRLGRDEAYARIRRRKVEQERNRQVILPETFRGHPKPLRAADLSLPEGHVLRGIPVSPGRVTARARVILDPRRDATIEPGEILVAPVTDAGWTPLFIAASGVVVDVGGTLSHGSTVAREYGLPAVVNVKHGTRMIRTGQTISIDGAQGVVVLEAGS